MHASRRRLFGATLTALIAAFQVGVLAVPALAAAGNVTVGNASVTEPGDVGRTSMVFNLTRAGGDQDAVVTYTVADSADTATAGEDYLKPPNGSITFEGSESTKELRIDVLGDALNEGDEMFSVTFASTTATIQGGTAGKVTGTILDDNDPAPRVSVSNGSAQEGDAGTRDASFFVTLSSPSGRVVTVNYATADGTGPNAAKAGPDYSATSGTLTFTPGQLAKTVAVPVKGDAVDEADETFQVKLTLPGGANATLGTAISTGTIYDDDGQPSVSVADVIVAEGAGQAIFTVSLSEASGRDVAVQATAADNTLPLFPSAKGGLDYIAASATVTIPAGQTSATFTVGILNDTLAEGSETFRVQLDGIQNAKTGDTSATGTIIDDDVAVLSINNIELAEGTGVLPKPFVFTVTRTGVTGGITTVKWETRPGTAQPGTDYFPPLNNSGTATFGADATTTTISVGVNQDTLNEGDETFVVRLLGDDGNVLAVGTARILDDDGGAAPQITVADVSVPEGAGKANFALTLTPASTAPVVVNVATKDGTAKAGADYTAAAADASVTFLPGQTTKAFEVSLVNDTADEDDETFTLELSASQNADIGDPSGTATIADDDNPPALSIQTLTIPEGDAGPTTADVKVTLSAASGKDITVDFATAAGTALDERDFSAAPGGTITFQAGETEKAVAVAALGDILDEADETFTITLSNVSATATIGTAVGTVTIADNDEMPTVRISNSAVDEPSDGYTVIAVFSVTLSAISGRDVTLDFATANDTARHEGPDNDYEPTSSPPKLTIPAGAGGASIVVEVNGDDDTDSDPTEKFTVSISNPTNATLAAGGEVGTGSIRDRDGPPVFSLEVASVNEGVVGGKSQITVRMFPSSASPATVTLATADGGATAPADYTAINKQIQFAAGQTIRTEDLTIVNDTVDEIDEDLTVALSNPVGSATIDALTGSAAVIIFDNDGPFITVSSPTVSEGSGPARFTVSLSAASPQEVKVDYSTNGESAVSPADFAFTAGTLTFAPGQRSKMVDVALVADTLDEDDETFSLSLSRPVNAVVAGSGRATIIDDDQPVVKVTAADADTDPVIEEGNLGARTMTFTVQLDAATTRDVVVDFATADGTAMAGVDYLAVNGRLTFTPGETVKTVAVPVLGDVLDEVDETVILRIPKAVNGTVAKVLTVGTIIDDDGVGYTLVASDGGIFAFGEADFVGSTGAMTLNQPIVGMAPHPSGRGYWLVASDGGIFAFGEAGFFGSAGDITLNKPITAMAATPTGNGYWLVATDGGIFNYGDAGFHGSTGAIKLTKPVTGMAASPSGKGYWLVADDGGIFAFGDAKFYGSTGDLTLNKPVVDMARTPTGLGYWLVASDGGIFGYGDAAFFGSTGDIVLNRPVVSMVATPSGKGYYLVADDGGVFKFGDGVFLGSTGDIKLNKPVVGIALL